MILFNGCRGSHGLILIYLTQKPYTGTISLTQKRAHSKGVTRGKIPRGLEKSPISPYPSQPTLMTRPYLTENTDHSAISRSKPNTAQLNPYEP
jgi:hypothetical protein